MWLLVVVFVIVVVLYVGIVLVWGVVLEVWRCIGWIYGVVVGRGRVVGICWNRVVL